MSTKPRLLVLTAAAVALTLAGCAPVVSPPTSSPIAGPTTQPSASATPTETPSPTPTPTPTATAASNVLFTISATAVASGANGATVDVRETVYAPVTTPSPTDTALLNNQCSGWKSQYPQAAYLIAESSSSLRAGSPAWPTSSTPVIVSIDGLAPTAYSGNFSGFESECASPIMKFPGHIHAVAVVSATASADSTKGWAHQRYGFGEAVDGPLSSIPAKDRIVISNCAITLGPVAKADPTASKWATTIKTQQPGGCFVGAFD